MERLKKIDDVRCNLHPSLLGIYDMAVSKYDRSPTRPVVEAKVGDSGKIEFILFKDIPRKVMGKIYDEIQRIKDQISCDYSLIYDIGSTPEENKYSFRIMI